jgi:riboflavin biosynthesis pyrimidine reductase
MMKRPEVICLMMTTVDGKILTENWGDDPKVKELSTNFEKAHEKIGISAWLVGRTTMEKDFTKGAQPIQKKDTPEIERADFVGDKNASSYAIVVDAHARLGWEKNTMHGDHVITILTEATPDGYLAHLQDIGVSYLFAGKTAVDLELALQKLHALFGIKKLMLEGGGHMNGSFLNEGLIDELNLLILPLADGTAASSTVFDINKEMKKGGATLLQLKEVKQIENDVLWITYKVK